MVSKPEVVKTETKEATPVPPPEPAPNGNKKEKETAKPTEEKESKKESSTPIIPPPVATIVTTTKSGRASKPSTPALVSTFAEASAVRSRPSRNTDIITATAKRSHKKGASSVSASAVALAAKLAAAEEAHSSAPEDEDEGEEPRYCYCNNVSYGEMVACDADGCAREWFHLGCVGLKVAPKGNGKLTPSLPCSSPTTAHLHSHGAIDDMLTFRPISEMVLRGLQKAIKIRREEGQRAIDVARLDSSTFFFLIRPGCRCCLLDSNPRRDMPKPEAPGGFGRPGQRFQADAKHIGGKGRQPEQLVFRESGIILIQGTG